MDNHSGVSLQDYFTVFRRRRFLMSWVFIGVVLLIIAATALFPERYRSSAFILIEAPQVRGEFVRTTMEVASTNLRIDRMRDRVVSAENLLPIIEELALYPDLPLEDRPGAMRADIDTPRVIDDSDPRAQITGGETIGFEVAFVHESAETAQLVAARLADLFLEENVASRTENVTQTSSFFAEQAERLKIELTRTEQALAEFKQRNAGSLPSDTDLNLQLLDRTQRDRDGVEREIRTLQERKNLLMAELARTSPSATLYSESGEPILGTDDRLEVARREYASMAARYGPEHPDLIKLRREIAALSDGTDVSTANESVQEELDAKRAELDALRQRYSADHPDVRRLERTIAGLVEQLRAAPAGSAAPSRREPNNPAYIELRVQIAGVDTELAALREDREEFRSRITDYETRISRAPETERELLMLTRDYEIASNDYDGIREKQAEAERAVVIEDQQRAERYVLQAGAPLPQSPAQPTHTTLLAIGIFLGITAAIGLGLLREALDVTVRGSLDVRSMLKAPPIAVIPMIENPRDVRQRLTRRTALAASFAATAFLGFLAVA